ncbi:MULTISPECIES: four-carbon acid sugar kinase family protein [Anaerococcus]|uniref:four-carbon acid sugar kinase family protein n=1 Tax=Anaerococcus TaxID=165779 RepID=UPI0027B969C3|nr:MULTISPECIES: four-carbon acid sugar kinase family protein [Anaerococcus]MDU2557820.1 four-carbon acid sugar kinase family protein [Anaerococcus prevotii]MDU3137176.1 four-carbon acid sugar kinase family protein [Anaerococcus prevotii]
MGKVIIIADDLTGANANCALMKGIGLRSASITGNIHEEEVTDIDVLAFTTDSRAMSSDQSYKRVKKKANQYKNDDVILFSKRIDSTLRGNLGSELKGFQDGLGGRLAICVPSFPDSNRIVVNDFMYVLGKPLMNTDAGKDSKISAVSNLVTENFKKDYQGEICHISIEEIEKGKDYVRDKIITNKDVDLIILDAITNDQIEMIAEAAIDTGLKFISVDPGPFTKEVTKLLYNKSEISTKAIAVIGSVTKVTMNQMKELEDNFENYRLQVDPSKLINIDLAIDEIKRAIELAQEKLNDCKLVIVTTTPASIEGRLNLKEISEKMDISIDDLSLMISRGLAKIASEIVKKDKSISGIFSSGGDVTIAVTEELGGQGIEIREEIEPLVAYGRVIGGEVDGLKIVSKGGMVGSEKVMIKCVDRLLNKGE